MHDLDWYVIQTWGGAESLARDWLTNMARAEVYYPVAKRIITTKAGEVEVDSCAFAGYIFARFHIDPNWAFIREHCNHLYGDVYLSTCEKDTDDPRAPLMRAPYRLVRNEEVESLKQREARGEFLENKDLAEAIKKSLLYTKVAVPYGPFQSKLGKIVNVEDDLVRLRVRVLGADGYMVFPINDLFPQGLPLT